MMTTDLWMLTFTCVLCLSLPFVYLVGRVATPGGLAWGVGNRETPFEFSGWIARSQRAHANLLETLPVFAALVLVAHVSGKAGELSALGAMTYFGARVAHALIYIAGLTGIRSIAFGIGVAGLALIVVQIAL